MTFAFGSFTLGAALLFSAFKNMSLVDLIMGREGESVSAQGESHPGAGGTAVLASTDSSNANATVSNASPSNAAGLKTWKNPDGTTVQIAIWIYIELKKVGFKGYIESGYRSDAEQARVCATGVKPCAPPGTSRHRGKKFPLGAIDVRQTEAAELAHKLQRIHSPLKYAGSKDPVHFSHPDPDGSY